MKKYTNKILIITVALVMVVTTTLFFIEASKIKEQIKQNEPTEQNNLTINH